MDIKQLFTDCARITREHGFKINEFATQIMLIASEGAEAMAHLNQADNPEQENINFVVLKNRFIVLMQMLENYRKNNGHVDNSYIKNYEEFIAEIVDIQIRLASFIGGNGFTEDVLQAMDLKMSVNKERPYLHGKGF